MTTAVYFDLDGTVLHHATPFDELFERTLDRFEEPASAGAYEAYTERLFEALDACEPAPYRRGFEAAREAGGLSTPAADLAAVQREVELEATVVPAAAKRVIERIAAGRPTGFLTNGAADHQRAKLERHGLASLVDEVVVSNAVGYRKPDERIFELARDRLPADEHVYVCDSYEEDVVPARESGFWTIYVADDPVEAEAADAVVADLGELAGFDRPLAILE